MLFIPRRRLVWWNNYSESVERPTLGGVPGHNVPLPDPPAGPEEPEQSGDRPDPAQWYVTRQDWIRSWSAKEQRYDYFQAYGRHEEMWSLLNQNWTVQMMPATAERLPDILSTQPQIPGMEQVRVPDLGSLNADDLEWLNNH